MVELFPLYHQGLFWLPHLSGDQVILPLETACEYVDSVLHSVGIHLQIYVENRAQSYLAAM